MRGDAPEDPALPVGFQHQPEFTLFQIAQSTMDQPARARAGARSEIVLLHQHGS